MSATEKVLWAVKKGNEDWQAELITSTADPAKLKAAKEWAVANGFDRLRVSTFTQGDKPDFIGTINGIKRRA